MALTIDELEIKINSDAKQATGGINSLTKSLEKLKTITSDISSTASDLQKLATAMTTLKDVGDVKVKITGLKALSNIGVSESTVTNLERVSNALKSFKDVPQKVSLLPIANGITALDNATKGLDATRLEQFATQISGVVTALQPLSTLGKSDLGSYFNQLKKIPEIINTLDNETLERFSVTVQKVTETLRPLAAEAEKLAPVFEKLPSSVKGAIKANEQLERSNRKLASSSNFLEKSLKRVVRQFASFFTLRKVYHFLSDCLEVSNDYQETLNLFAVALGDATEEMKAYAKTVETVMGIDSAEWMNNQAVFMQTLTGFGVAEDEAASMSKTLTQLGYDIASLWNADTDLVMSRLESAMTGQIKGMKNYGYNVSVAALKETALALGIEKSVSAMTEAEKAQLRFITIMRNADGTMGDMAHTLLSPANAMRVYASTITRLKRALGDIISVLLTRFLPYMQATVELLTELANHIAISFGFEVKELPPNVTDSVGDLTGELENGQDEAKELKKQLMGFDELNILKSDDNGDGITNSLGIDMKLYDYEFLKDADRSKIEEIKNDIRNMVDGLRQAAKWAAVLGGIFVAWKFATGFSAGLTTIMGLFGSKKIGGSGSKVFSVPKVSTILKGLADFGIIVIGVVALIGTLGLLASIPGAIDIAKNGIELVGIVFDGLFDIILPLSLIGSFIVGLGYIGVPTVVKGLADFAVIVGGVTTLIGVLGALASIPGVDDAIDKGISTVVNVFNGLYEVTLPLSLIGSFIVGLGYIGVSTIAKGFADFAIIVGGVTALVGVLGGLALIPGVDDAVNEGLSLVTDVFNTLGGMTEPLFAVSGLCAVLGAIGPAIVAEGLAGFAIVLGGVSLVLTALGALKQIEGFDWIVSEGTDILVQLGTAIGGFTGAIAGATLDFATSTLPNVGEHLAGFMEKAEPFFTGLKNIKAETVVAVGLLAGAMVALTTADVIESLSFFITGGNSLVSFGKELQAFAPYLVAFGNEVVKMPEGADDAIDVAAGAIGKLAVVSQLIPNSGGLWQGIFGNNDIGKWGEDLEAFGTNIVNFADTIKDLDTSAITNAETAMKVLVAINRDIPTTGGVWSWLFGDKSIDDWGRDLEDFGDTIVTFSNKIGSLNSKNITAAENAIKVLLAVNKEIPITGGLWSWLAGDRSIDDWGRDLVDFGECIRDFADELGTDFPASMVESAGNAAMALANLNNSLPESGGVKQWFTGSKDLEDFGKAIPKLAEGLKNFGSVEVSTSKVNSGMLFLERFVNIGNSAKNAASGFDTIISKLKELIAQLSKLKNPDLDNFQLKVRFVIEGLTAPEKKAYSMAGLSGKPVYEWAAYANGGFPNMGEMFIARESGPEMVGRIGNKTAVANNSQIINGITSGVYRAMMMAQADGGSNNGGTARIIVQIGDRAVGEAAVEYINGEIRQTGTNPINY